MIDKDNKHIEYIFKEVAEETGISITKVRDIYYQEMKLLYETMTNGSNVGFRMKYLGLFGIKKKRLLYDRNYNFGKELIKEFDILTNTQIKRLIGEKRRERRKNK